MSRVEQEIALALDIQAPCIWVKTIEEVEALNTVVKVLTRRTSCNSMYEFSIIKGLISTNIGNSVDKKVDVLIKAPDFALAAAKIADDKTKLRGVKPVILKDFHAVLEKPTTLRAVRDLCEPYKDNKTNLYTPLVVVSDSLSLPHDVEHLITVIEYDTPSKDSIATIIRAFNAKAEEKGGNLITDREALELVDVMRGLTKQDIITSMRASVKKNGRVLVSDILNQKIELIKKTGILDYRVPTASFNEIGGNNYFKQWVEEVEACMQPEAKEFGIQSPKGYLALGVPGTSKTLMANALANKLNRPFIKLDVSKIMSRFVGESERNMARALELVQSCSPCVFLIDEIEKTLSGVQSSGQSDGGATAKVFGLLLEFLNDSKDVFTVMTSNDVRQLPPELTRAGRLDAIWYFSLPTQEEREEIYRVHLNKVNKTLDEQIIKKIAKHTNNFTGAEIEQTVKIALRKAFLNKFRQNSDGEITLDILKESSSMVIPVATSSREKISSLEQWARSRALFANQDAAIDIDENIELENIDFGLGE